MQVRHNDAIARASWALPLVLLMLVVLATARTIYADTNATVVAAASIPLGYVDIDADGRPEAIQGDMAVHSDGSADGSLMLGDRFRIDPVLGSLSCVDGMTTMESYGVLYLLENGDEVGIGVLALGIQLPQSATRGALDLLLWDPVRRSMPDGDGDIIVVDIIWSSYLDDALFDNRNDGVALYAGLFDATAAARSVGEGATADLLAFDVTGTSDGSGGGGGDIDLGFDIINLSGDYSSPLDPCMATP